MKLEKAVLQEIDAKPSPNPVPVGKEIPVQINPSSLRLQLANNVDMGKAFARPNTQYLGSQSSTLTFDLIFDSADEGTTEEPVDVRTRTRQLERFLLPKKGAKAVPPRVLFRYGTLEVVGVMTSMSQEFDLFALNAVPLRAKCSVTIKEQKPEFDANLAGPGANTGAGATPPIPPAGGTGALPSDRTGTALGGESASDFANRMGLDPRAWKGLEGITDSLSLEAGLQIDFSASLSLDVGLGVQLGATASLDTGGGRSGAAPARRSPGDRPTPPPVPTDSQAIAAQGGITRAVASAAASQAAAAAGEARAAFPAPEVPVVTLPPLARGAAGAGPSTGGAAPAEPVPVPPVEVDRRATSYGFGVPLRPRVGGRPSVPVAQVHARGAGAAPLGGVPETDDPTVPPWLALPAATPASARGGQPGWSLACACTCGCAG